MEATMKTVAIGLSPGDVRRPLLRAGTGMKRFAFILLTIAVVPLISAGAEPQITEFMAANTATFADEDGAYSDWIEIYNPGPAPVNLSGWFLTDTATNRTKWQFPTLSLAAEEFVVVWASNKNRREPARPLHTNFALSSSGEYLGLIKPDGVTVVSAFAPIYPPQRDDVSFGVSQL
jgi:hypothetical protein